MSGKPRTAIKIISSLERLYNSVNGNPRFHVWFTDGTGGITMSDASVNCGLTNPEYRGVPVVFTFTRAGRISHATPAKA